MRPLQNDTSMLFFFPPQSEFHSSESLFQTRWWLISIETQQSNLSSSLGRDKWVLIIDDTELFNHYPGITNSSPKYHSLSFLIQLTQGRKRCGAACLGAWAWSGRDGTRWRERAQASKKYSPLLTPWMIFLPSLNFFPRETRI